MSALGIAAVGLVMAVGLVGSVLPFVPGLVLVWGAGLVYGFVAGFGTVGGVAFAVMTVLLLAGTLAQVVLPTRRGAARGASRGVLLAGALGGVVGFFVVPVLGLPLGAVAGVLVAEHQRSGDWARAWDLTKSVLVGFGLGALAEFAAGLAMIIAWVVWVVAG
jgi:uncharacterized protein YqgC (DUF456 family)